MISIERMITEGLIVRDKEDVEDYFPANDVFIFHGEESDSFGSWIQWIEPPIVDERPKLWASSEEDDIAFDDECFSVYWRIK